MVQKVVDHFGFTKVEDIHRIEDLIANELKSNMRGQKRVFAFLVERLGGTPDAEDPKPACADSGAETALVVGSPGEDGTPNRTVGNAVKILGETLVVPGSSLLFDGEVRSGGLHLVGGLLSKAMLGPIGILAYAAFAANSYSRSVTGNSLLQSLRGSAPRRS